MYISPELSIARPTLYNPVVHALKTEKKKKKKKNKMHAAGHLDAKALKPPAICTLS
jgi:hypothetical protein